MLSKIAKRTSNLLPTLRRSVGASIVRCASNEQKQQPQPPKISHVDFDFNNIVELQRVACKTYHTNPLFGTHVGSSYDWLNYQDFGKKVDDCRKVLQKLNVGKNDKVAIISANRVEWAVVFYAVAGVGAQLVPMYEAQLPSDWEFILTNSGAKLLIVSTEAVHEKTKDYVGKISTLQASLCFDAPSDRMHSFQRWMSICKEDAPVPAVEPNASDVVLINYTAGTTGNPKGVEISHQNVVQVLLGLRQLRPKGDQIHYESVGILPWAHIYGQVVELNGSMARGSAIGIVKKRELIFESIGLVKPSLIMSVPVMHYKVYDSIWKKVGESSPVRQKIFRRALEIARHRNSLLEKGETVPKFLALKHRLADKVVFSKIRQALGGNVKFMGSGGAALTLPVLEFFEDIGIPICEGYGLTETCSVVSTSTYTWEHRKIGCVGVILPGLDVRIVDPSTSQEVAGKDDEGEICCSGPTVMVGYYNNPKANEESFFYLDGKRFFRTGDLGRKVDGRFLKITGRIKEQFKLSNGKFVVPGPVEDCITRSPYISQCLIYGDHQPTTVALLVPEINEIRNWAKGKDELIGLSDELLIEHPLVKQLLATEVESAFPRMKSYERPTKWMTTAEPFTQENQMLTPKMSLRRNKVLAKYKDSLLRLYEN